LYAAASPLIRASRRSKKILRDILLPCLFPPGFVAAHSGLACVLLYAAASPLIRASRRPKKILRDILLRVVCSRAFAAGPLSRASARLFPPEDRP
jgi:hypothetical protein